MLNRINILVQKKFQLNVELIKISLIQNKKKI